MIGSNSRLALGVDCWQKRYHWQSDLEAVRLVLDQRLYLLAPGLGAVPMSRA